MTDTLRDRIAAAIGQADKRVAGFISNEERADAVIAALGLGIERGCGCGPGGNYCQCSDRIVGRWSACRGETMTDTKEEA